MWRKEPHFTLRVVCRAMLGKIAYCPTRSCPNAGHGINTEDPGAFNAHLADFFHTVDLGKMANARPARAGGGILGNR
jgi:hypothetical protein